jgi:hypothetical protein
MLADAAGPWWTMKTLPSASRVSLQVNGSSIDLAMPETGEMTFHLLLDASVAEFFCNDRHVLTSRIYRRPAGPLSVHLIDPDLSVLRGFEAWQLHPISPDRLTS